MSGPLSIYVRKTGLEPVRPCERHPLKMVRLPISPLPQREYKHTERSEPSKGYPVAVRGLPNNRKRHNAARSVNRDTTNVRT